MLSSFHETNLLLHLKNTGIHPLFEGCFMPTRFGWKCPVSMAIDFEIILLCWFDLIWTYFIVYLYIYKRLNTSSYTLRGSQHTFFYVVVYYIFSIIFHPYIEVAIFNEALGVINILFYVISYESHPKKTATKTFTATDTTKMQRIKKR